MGDTLDDPEESNRVDHLNSPDGGSGLPPEATQFSAKAQQDKFLGGGGIKPPKEDSKSPNVLSRTLGKVADWVLNEPPEVKDLRLMEEEFKRTARLSDLEGKSVVKPQVEKSAEVRSSTEVDQPPVFQPEAKPQIQPEFGVEPETPTEASKNFLVRVADIIAKVPFIITGPPGIMGAMMLLQGELPKRGLDLVGGTISQGLTVENDIYGGLLATTATSIASKFISDE